METERRKRNRVGRDKENMNRREGHERERGKARQIKPKGTKL
jgi:hypothetical protein